MSGDKYDFDPLYPNEADEDAELDSELSDPEEFRNPEKNLADASPFIGGATSRKLRGHLAADDSGRHINIDDL